jgi:hypothetical protein
MVLHSVTLWTGAWESGSGWGLGVPNHFGGPWSITLCNTPKNLPTLVLAPSLFPHSLNSLSLRSLFVTHNSAQSLMVLLNGPPLSNFVDRGLGEWEWLGPGSTKIRSWSSKMGPVRCHTTQRRFYHWNPFYTTRARFDIGVRFHTTRPSSDL